MNTQMIFQVGKEDKGKCQCNGSLFACLSAHSTLSLDRMSQLHGKNICGMLRLKTIFFRLIFVILFFSICCRHLNFSIIVGMLGWLLRFTHDILSHSIVFLIFFFIFFLLLLLSIWLETKSSYNLSSFGYREFQNSTYRTMWCIQIQFYIFRLFCCEMKRVGEKNIFLFKSFSLFR